VPAEEKKWDIPQEIDKKRRQEGAEGAIIESMSGEHATIVKALLTVPRELGEQRQGVPGAEKKTRQIVVPTKKATTTSGYSKGAKNETRCFSGGDGRISMFRRKKGGPEVRKKGKDAPIGGIVSTLKKGNLKGPS